MSTLTEEPGVVPSPGLSLEEDARLKRETEALRARLSWLSEATLRVTEDLDLGTVLQEVIDGARWLTGARYGALLILDRLGGIEDLITSGITPEEAEAIRAEPKGLGLLGFLNEVEGPLRLRDIASHPRSVGFPEGHPPMKSFLGIPVRHRGERFGNLYLTDKQGGPEFTPEDEETITLFAAHAAAAISNARRYSDERRNRADLEALNDRFLRLSESMRILSESLDVDTVLNQVVTGARVLTGAHYGLITTVDESGHLVDFGTSGFTPEERQQMLEMPRGTELLDHFHSIPGSRRISDSTAHVRALGFDGDLPPFKATLYTPMYVGNTRLGNFYLANREGGPEFTEADEELMSVFAAQAAVAVVNARAHQAEQRAKADLEALVDTSPVGVLVFDAKTMGLVSVNQETRRIVRGVRPSGHSQAELLSTLRPQRPDGQEIPLSELPPARAIRSGGTVRAEELVIGLPDGQKVPVIVNATPVFSEEGEAVSVITTMQDVTPLARLERLRTEFIGMVSHELRTPLAAIKGSAATVLGASSGLDHTEVRQFLRIIDEQADRMLGLIGDLLDMTQIEAGTLSVAPEPTDLEDLVEGARRAFLRGGATSVIEADIPPDMPPVEVDRQRMTHVLNNLFTHASRHSPGQSTIRVNAAAEGVNVSISVTDEGMGVPAEDLPNLFRKYSTVDGEDGGRQSAGEGLGLAICKGIVEAHGGRIWAESGGPGLGTRFTFTVPSVEEAVDRPEAGLGLRPADPERTTRGEARVLAVDDDPHTLLHLRNTLREAGYTPLVTGNPREAERMVQTEKPHLVLLNRALSDADGIEMMERIRELIDAPVIFLSEHADDEDVAQVFEMGADDYIVKPYSPAELVARVRAALRRQSAPERTSARELYLLGGLAIDYAERRVTVGGRPVQLTSTEYRLLSNLSINAGRVMTHDQLLSQVWGPGYSGDSQPVRTFVKNLRNKLGDDARNPTYIFTEPRVGYRMAKSGEGGRNGGPDTKGRPTPYGN